MEVFLVEQEEFEAEIMSASSKNCVPLRLLLKRELPMSSTGNLSSVLDKLTLFSLLLMELERFNIR